MSGQTILKALQWSVSAYPQEDGRFPQISGLQFLFDPEKPAERRIFQAEVYTDDGSYLNMNKLYKVAMPQYIAEGGDGYSMFQSDDVKIVVDDENALRVIDIVK